MDRGPRCAHGYGATPTPHAEYGDGWLIDIPNGCPVCKGVPSGIPYKPGEPPGKRSVEEVAKDIQRRAVTESKVRPLQIDPGRCLECGRVFGPNTVRFPVAGGGFRHASGSPACSFRGPSPRSQAEAPPPPVAAPEPEERPVTPPNQTDQPAASEEPEEPCACPTCGRPVVEGAPYDLQAIRRALQDALAAVDDLIAGEAREQEALEELDEPT